MPTDYNSFANTFSNSRKNMKWEELYYFLDKSKNYFKKKDLSILDVWCWNARLLSHIKELDFQFKNYLWIDSSKALLKEAKIYHPEVSFLNLNMLNLETIKEKYNLIFFIASFHHLDKLEDRIEVLQKTYDKIKSWWLLFITNWSLRSEINYEKYKNSIIPWSENEFWSFDYEIKIWEYKRYYHCFNLKELGFIFRKTHFEIIENREFENKKNFLSILKKR